MPSRPIVRLMAGIAAITVTTAVPSLSQTASEIQIRFSTFLGPEKYALIVWQKQGGSGKPEPYYEGTANYLMFVDTKVGETKTYKDRGGYYTEPSFTPDGTRIVYYNMMTKDIRIMNSDGTNDKSLVTGYNMLGDTWLSSDGTQWFLAGKSSSSSNCNYLTTVTVERIEIDNTSNKVQLATNAFPHFWEAYDCRPIDWAGLSPDGRYLTGGFPRYGYLGIYDTQVDSLHTLTINGCWISMARDGSNNLLYTDEPQAHRGVYIIDINQNEVLKQSHVSILPPSGFYESLRWTPERDYITYAALDQQGNYAVPNPRLVRLSDVTYVAVHDNTQYAEGNADVFFYGTGTSVARDRLASAPSRSASAMSASARLYDCRGRALGTDRPAFRGVYVLPASGHGSRPALCVK